MSSSSTSPTPSVSSSSTLYAERDDHFAGRPKSGGYFTPRVLSATPCYEPDHRQAYSESSVSMSTLMEAPKRRAESPTLRQREPRKVAMMSSMNPIEEYRVRHRQMDEASLPPRQPLERPPPLGDAHLFRQEGASTHSDHALSFWDDSEDTIEMLSNKRPKNEERGVSGRRSRRDTWTKPKTSLRRTSTSTLIRGMDRLTNHDDEEEEITGGAKETKISSVNSSFIFLDKVETAPADIKSGTPCRRPLQDISIAVADTDILVSISGCA